MSTEFEVPVTSGVLKKSDAPSMPLWLKVLLGAISISVVVALYEEAMKSPYYNYTPEQFAYAEQMRTNIRSGGHVEGAILEFRNGEIGFISRAESDGSAVRIVFPRGKKVYVNVRTRKDEPMYNILSITRASDPNYPSMREKVLPVRKLPL